MTGKCIRLISIINHRGTNNLQGYLVLDTRIGGVTGVTPSQLYDMRNALINVSEVSCDGTKFKPNECALIKVPIIEEAGAFNYRTIKAGIWVVGKNRAKGTYDIILGDGSQYTVSKSRLLSVVKDTPLVNACVDGGVIRGTRRAIPNKI